MSALEDAVTQDEDGSWRFTCQAPVGTCAPFVSSQWPTKATALARGREHALEHAEGKPMTDLHEFREAHGLTVDADGRAVAK